MSICCYACREAAGGRQPKQGLQRPISNCIGLRSNGSTDIQPDPYFGNALSIALVQPPSNSANGNGLKDSLAAGACAIRQATEAFRADAAGSAHHLHAGLPTLVQVSVKSPMLFGQHRASPATACLLPGAHTIHNMLLCIPTLEHLPPVGFRPACSILTPPTLYTSMPQCHAFSTTLLYFASHSTSPFGPVSPPLCSLCPSTPSPISPSLHHPLQAS